VTDELNGRLAIAIDLLPPREVKGHFARTGEENHQHDRQNRDTDAVEPEIERAIRAATKCNEDHAHDVGGDREGHGDDCRPPRCSVAHTDEQGRDPKDDGVRYERREKNGVQLKLDPYESIIGVNSVGMRALMPSMDFRVRSNTLALLTLVRGMLRRKKRGQSATPPSTPPPISPSSSDTDNDSQEGMSHAQ
jgi:hypothetical protein